MFPTFRKMYKYAKHRYGDDSDNYQAVCWDSKREDYCIGELLFSIEDLTPEFITHEVTHAAKHYLKVIPRTPGRLLSMYENPSHEEYSATIAGLMVQQIFNNLYALRMEMYVGKKQS